MKRRRAGQDSPADAQHASVHPAIQVRIDLTRVRENTRAIREQTGVPIIAVVKADAYGLGLPPVMQVIDDLVESYYFFQPSEVVTSAAHTLTTKSFLCGMCGDASAGDLLAHRIRPAVWTIEQAVRWRDCRPALSIDTGQQRFAAPVAAIDAIARAGEIHEAFTHASNLEQVRQFAAATDGRQWRRHAAATSMLAEPAAAFDAVRPGFALFRGAVTTTTRLLEARDSTGPAGYTGFASPRHGVIFGGYSDGIAPGICAINGTRRRVIETGMQTSFVELGAGDRAGDAVTLLGDGLIEHDVAAAWGCTVQQALWRLATCGRRLYG